VSARDVARLHDDGLNVPRSRRLGNEAQGAWLDLAPAPRYLRRPFFSRSLAIAAAIPSTISVVEDTVVAAGGSELGLSIGALDVEPGGGFVTRLSLADAGVSWARPVAMNLRDSDVDGNSVTLTGTFFETVAFADRLLVPEQPWDTALVQYSLDGVELRARLPVSERIYELQANRVGGSFHAHGLVEAFPVAAAEAVQAIAADKIQLGQELVLRIFQTDVLEVRV
jgi:hypothetical protein